MTTNHLEFGIDAAKQRLERLQDTFNFVLQTAPHDIKRIYELINEMAQIEKSVNKAEGK